MKPFKAPRVMKRPWKQFITDSMKRPKLGQWSDMCLAPTNVFVLLHCEASRYYSFYEGQAIGICIKHKLSRTDPHADEYRWFMVGQVDRDNVFQYTQCNPHWWMPLPMAPPERPQS